MSKLWVSKTLVSEFCSALPLDINSTYSIGKVLSKQDSSFLTSAWQLQLLRTQPILQTTKCNNKTSPVSPFKSHTSEALHLIKQYVSILPIPKGMNASFLIIWPFSSRNLVGWKSSGFSQILGSLCTDHKLGTITLPFGIVYPCSTSKKKKHKDKGFDKLLEANTGDLLKKENITKNDMDL